MSGLLALALAAMPFLWELAGTSDEVTQPKLLDGNPRIPYPALANKEAIAGPVRFRMRVSAEGTVESVEVQQVPEAGLGFEEAIREGVRRWRFEPAHSGAVAVPLTVETQLRFRLSPEAESAIDGVLEAFQKAWNDGRIADMAALLDSTYLLRSKEDTDWMPMDAGRARDWLATHRSADVGGLALELRSIQFLRAELAKVVLQFQRTGSPPEATTRKELVTSYLLKNGARWRIVRFGSQPFKPPRANSLELEPRRVGGAIVPPRKIHTANPVYPDDAKGRGIQGTVVLECVIDPEGNMKSVEVILGPEPLVEAAATAVRQWRYTPTLLDGKAVPVIMTVTVNFRLSQRQ